MPAKMMRETPLPMPNSETSSPEPHEQDEPRSRMMTFSVKAKAVRCGRTFLRLEEDQIADCPGDSQRRRQEARDTGESFCARLPSGYHPV